MANKYVRFTDGRIIKVDDNDVLTPNPNSILHFSNIRKPLAWYKKNNEQEEFRPHNCEQPLLHVLDFWLKQKIKQHQKSIFTRMQPLPSSFEEFANLIKSLKEKDVFKENVEGIEYVCKI